MNQAQHTPGPWTICEHSWSDTSIYSKDDKLICRMSIYDEATEENQQDLEREMGANARRIVACVNACKGINPEAVPDLLNALRLAHERLLYHAPLDNAISVVGDVLAKAKLQTP